MKLLALLLAAAAAATPLPESALAVRDGGAWSTWWRASEAPARWTAALPAVSGQVRWRRASRGVEWGELDVAGDGEAWRTRVILVRLDPRQLAFRLVKPADYDNGMPGRWSIDEAPDDAVLAFNAGQFAGGPWGWVVRDGVEEARPGTGPLAPGIVVDRDGGMRLVPPDSLASARGGAALAFQSYPTLLERDGDVPAALRDAGLGVNLTHRDARLAIGELRDGRILVAMTRFQGLRGALELLPFGFTTPEMAAVMGALGCRRAVLLDGGISSQLMLRDGGRLRSWPGMRKVALALVATERVSP